MPTGTDQAPSEGPISPLRELQETPTATVDAGEQGSEDGSLVADNDRDNLASSDQASLPKELSALKPWVLTIQHEQFLHELQVAPQQENTPSTSIGERLLKAADSAATTALSSLDRLRPSSQTPQPRPALVKALFARAWEDGCHKASGNTEFVQSVSTFLRAAESSEVPTSELRAARERLESVSVGKAGISTGEAPPSLKDYADVAWHCLTKSAEEFPRTGKSLLAQAETDHWDRYKRDLLITSINSAGLAVAIGSTIAFGKPWINLSTGLQIGSVAFTQALHGLTSGHSPLGSVMEWAGEQLRTRRSIDEGAVEASSLQGLNATEKVVSLEDKPGEKGDTH